MQIKNIDIENSKDSEKDEKTQIQTFKKRAPMMKKRASLLVKLLHNVDLKHVANIGNICFVNEDALRFPDQSDQTLIKSIYHYNMISKVTINKSFINIALKKNNGDFLPPQYYFQRLRSFGDKQLADMALHVQNIYRQFSMLKQSCPIQEKTFSKENQKFILQKFLAQKQGKKYLLSFSEITPQKITLKNMIYSVPLLQALGCNIKNIGLDYLKYKHVFFDVFTAKNYGSFLERSCQNFGKIQKGLMKNPNMSEQERIQLTQMTYYDEVIIQSYRPHGIYEEPAIAKVWWYSPHPSICYFQIIDIHEKDSSMLRKKKLHLTESKPQEQIQMLKKIGHTEPFLEIQENATQQQFMEQSLRIKNLRIEEKQKHNDQNIQESKFSYKRSMPTKNNQQMQNQEVSQQLKG